MGDSALNNMMSIMPLHNIKTLINETKLVLIKKGISRDDME